MKDIEKLCMGCMNEFENQGICPHCGYDDSQPVDKNYLIPGTKIMKRFVVGRVLETNGEGVTYICYDAKTDKTVLLREYYPIGLCDRVANGFVKAKEGASEVFSKGLKKFMNLAEKLADHPEITAIPSIIELFEGNGTGYSVYEYYESITLREFLLRNGGTLAWEQASTIFLPLLSTIRALHDVGILHRGISPETILICKDGRVRLTGLCISDVRTMGTAFVPQIFPGFAAVEQYGSIGEQGPWTDVYAISATIYRVLVGNPPVESIERVTNDTLTIPSKVINETPSAVCEAIADGLEIIPEERTRTVDHLRSYIAKAVNKKKNKVTKGKKSGKYKSYMILATIMTTLVIAAVSAVIYVFVIMPNIQQPIPDVSSQDIISSETSSVESQTESTSSIIAGTVKVDNFIGSIYQETIQNIDFSKYNFVIDSKEYSASYSARKIISQEPEAGTMVDPDESGKITIRVVISMGDYNISMPDLTGMSEQDAILALLKVGFQYNNISVNEQYDVNAKPLSVTTTLPAKNEKVNLDSPIVLTINTYKGTTSSQPTDTSSDQDDITSGDEEMTSNKNRTSTDTDTSSES